MKINIGMLIWKEMKSQGFTQKSFQRLLTEKKVSIRDLFKLESIDAYALIHISALLNKNFFELYNAEQLNTLLKAEKRERDKDLSLKSIIAEQEKILASQHNIITQQARLIMHLKALIEDPAAR